MCGLFCGTIGAKNRGQLGFSSECLRASEECDKGAKSLKHHEMKHFQK